MLRPVDFANPYGPASLPAALEKRAPAVMDDWIDDLESQAAAMTKVLHDMDVAAAAAAQAPPSSSGPASLDDWVLASFRGRECFHPSSPPTTARSAEAESCPSCRRLHAGKQLQTVSVSKPPASLPEQDRAPSVAEDLFSSCPALGFLNFQISRLRLTQASLERELHLRARIIAEQQATIVKLRAANAVASNLSAGRNDGKPGGNRHSWDPSRFSSLDGDDFDDGGLLLRELETVRQKVLELEKRNVELDERCFRLELENGNLKQSRAARGLFAHAVCK